MSFVQPVGATRSRRYAGRIAVLRGWLPNQLGRSCLYSLRPNRCSFRSFGALDLLKILLGHFNLDQLGIGV